MSERPWESEIVYHIFVRSFRDSNGDGHGDFQGIVQGLDTIQKLGCTAILLSPVVKSRCYHNYFADDLKDTDPRFGTLADFRAMVEAAHRRNLRVVLDMEPQYVADGHPWLKAAKGNRDAPSYRYLVDPSGKAEWGGLPWYDGQRFAIASLRLNEPDVREMVWDVFRFWFDQGVDGFRIDHMMDDLDWQGVQTNLMKDLWAPIVAELKAKRPDAFFVGEQSDWEAYQNVLDIFGKTPTDAVFGFRFRRSILTWEKVNLQKGLREAVGLAPKGRTQLTFLENHDLERYASIEPDPRRRRLAAALLFLTKGTPSLYYGQELGMKGIQGTWGSDGNDIPVRLAYRWKRRLESPETPLWYKDSGPWWNRKYSDDGDGISLEEQQDDERSLFRHYARLATVRKANPALALGTQTVIETETANLVVFRRTAPGQDLVVAVNLSDRVLAAPLPIPGAFRDLWTDKPLERNRLRLDPWGFAVLAPNAARND